MRSIPLLLTLFLALWLAVPASAVTWGAFNPSTRTITATENGNTVTIKMPYPWGDEISGDKADNASYSGTSGDYYLYTKPGHPNSGGHYRLKLEFQGGSLFVTIDSTLADNPWVQVIGPKVLTNSTWRRVDVSRFGETIGHPFNQKASYLDTEDLWVWAFWQAEESHGVYWKLVQPTYNPNSGSGTMRIAPDMLYFENLADYRQPLHEKLEIRVGDDLWDSVPTFPASRKSPWAEALADTVYVDSWSHDSAAELAHQLRLLQRIAGEGTSFFSNWASWAAGGHDGFLPDALWLDHNPPYPANHDGFGSLESMREFADLGDATGWMSFRTFYSQLREEGPSYQQGAIRLTLNASGGNTSALTKRGDQVAIYQRQEPDIKAHLGSSGLFTDTICKSFPWSHHDYDGTIPDGLRMKKLVQYDRDFADFAEATHGGPVTCEGLNNETLLGTWAATGEFDLYATMLRLLTPEYKLRRLHGLSTFHGAGLNYRSSEISADWRTNRYGWRAQHELDNYRTVQLLFGNGAFLYVENKLEDTVWSHLLGELLIVRPLQEHFALVPVNAIEYETSGQGPGTWSTLEDLVENQGFVMKTNAGAAYLPDPNSTENPPPLVYTLLDQSPEFERIRVTYQSGLTIAVNRGESDFTVNAGGQNLVLPSDAWAAWGTIGGDSVLAYSAYAPGTTERIDFLEDFSQGLRYVDPRGSTHFGVDRPTQWVRKNGAWRVRLEAELDADRPAVVLEGQRLLLPPSRRQAPATVDHDFSQGFGGWRTLRGHRVATIGVDGLELELDAKLPFLHSPFYDLAGSSGDVIEVDFRVNAPASGDIELGLLWKREEDAPFLAERFLNVETQVTGGWQTISFPVGTHALWDGETIKQLRLDLSRGRMPLPPPIDMTVGAVRLVSSP